MVNGGECKPCTEGCTTCTFAVDSCTVCSEGYESNGTDCVKKGPSGGDIAGIVIGVIAALGIVGALIWYFMFYHKKGVVSQVETGVPVPIVGSEENSHQEIEIAVESGTD